MAARQSGWQVFDGLIFEAFGSDLTRREAISTPFGVQLVGDRGRWGIEEVFQATEYLPYARSTHQRSPDEAVHEIQID